MRPEDQMIRTSVAIGDNVFALAQSQDLESIKQEIVTAVRAGGDFVNFVVLGNREVSLFVSPASGTIVFSVETVPHDARDTGDIGEPFGGFYDVI